MLFDQNRVDAIIHNWKNQVFSNETIPGVPQRHSTCLKPPNGGFWNLASRGYTRPGKTSCIDRKQCRDKYFLQVNLSISPYFQNFSFLIFFSKLSDHPRALEVNGWNRQHICEDKYVWYIWCGTFHIYACSQLCRLRAHKVNGLGASLAVLTH